MGRNKQRLHTLQHSQAQNKEASLYWSQVPTPTLLPVPYRDIRNQVQVY